MRVPTAGLTFIATGKECDTRTGTLRVSLIPILTLAGQDTSRVAVQKNSQISKHNKFQMGHGDVLIGLQRHILLVQSSLYGTEFERK